MPGKHLHTRVESRPDFLRVPPQRLQAYLQRKVTVMKHK